MPEIFFRYFLVSGCTRLEEESLLWLPSDSARWPDEFSPKIGWQYKPAFQYKGNNKCPIPWAEIKKFHLTLKDPLTRKKRVV